MTGLKLFSVLQLLVRISLQSQECEVYPSEYAYHKDSVTREETASANCKEYPTGLAIGSLGSEDHIHCDGRLTDSDLGPEQYSSSYYYEWKAETSRTRQLLFIFPTRVNSTTITLHYYSDSQRGLPRLRFYAAPDDFDVWDATPGDSIYVGIAAVPPGEESAGRRNVSISVNFSTTKILMLKLGSTYKLAVSEVDFINPTNENRPTSSTPTLAQGTTAIVTTDVIVTSEMTPTYRGHQNITDQTQERTTFPQARSGDKTSSTVIASAVTALVLMVLLVTSLFVLALLCYKRRSHKPHPDTSVDNADVSYSTLDRGTKKVGLSAPLNDSSELYDQIQLSPCTGQSEVLSETKDSPETEKVLECPTYAVVDKKKKKKTPQSKSKEKESEALQDQQCQDQVNLEEMYAVVNKKPKKKDDKEQEAAPPIPEHTIEALYTAIQK